MEVLRRMAAVVDRRNAGDLVVKGREVPDGYTKPPLHDWRKRRKASLGS
jgi:hypothetical protein